MEIQMAQTRKDKDWSKSLQIKAAVRMSRKNIMIQDKKISTKSVTPPVIHERVEMHLRGKTPVTPHDAYKISKYAFVRYNHKRFGIPSTWDRTSLEGKIAFCHHALVEWSHFSLSVNISAVINKKALLSGNYTRYIKTRIDDALKSEFTPDERPEFWFALEGVISSSDKAHIHGAITYIGDTRRAEARTRRALKFACGSDYPKRAGQCYLRDFTTVEDGCDLYWAHTYCIKELSFDVDTTVYGKRFARSSSLVPKSKLIYNGWRLSIIERIKVERLKKAA